MALPERRHVAGLDRSERVSRHHAGAPAPFLSASAAARRFSPYLPPSPPPIAALHIHHETGRC